MKFSRWAPGLAVLAPLTLACSSTPTQPEPIRDLTVVFTPTGGTFLEQETVSLSVADPKAELHYTLDGSIPSAASPKYASPIAITKSTRLTALAIRPVAAPPSSMAAGGASGMEAGPVNRESYLRVAPDAAVFTSHLPVLLIQTFESGALDPESDRFVPAELQLHGARTTGLVGRAEVDSRIGIHVRGQTSRGFAKKQYSVELWEDASDTDQDRVLLDLPEDSDWILSDPVSMDRSLIRNALGFELSRRIGRYAPRTRFLEGFLVDDSGDVRSAKFVGLYTLTEKIKRGSQRVDVAKLEASATTEPAISGGYVLRIDKGEQAFQAAGRSFQFVYPDEDDMKLSVRQPQLAFIRQFIEQFGAAVKASNHQHPMTGLHYGEYIDQDAFIDHHLLNTLLKNVDALRISAYFHKDRAGRLAAGPLWDLDRSSGTPYDERARGPEEWKKAGTDGTDYFEEGLWGPLFDDPAFRSRYRKRFLALLGAELSEASLTEAVDTLAAQVGAAAARNFTRWSDSPPRDGSHAAELTLLKDFLRKRAAWIRSQLQTWPE